MLCDQCGALLLDFEIEASSDIDQTICSDCMEETYTDDE